MQSGRRVLNAFTEALDALGAKPRILRVLRRVDEEVIPGLEKLVKDVDRVLDRAAEVKHTIKTELADEEN